MGTVWLLDVDGVINASRPGWGRAPRSAMAYANGTGYRLRWEPGLIDRIREANLARHVEVRWATTWCDHAAELSRTLGLTLPVAFGPRPAHLTFDEQKVRAAIEVLDAGDRLIWTDDSVVPVALSMYPRFAYAVDDGRALLIAPRPSRGLREADMDAIEAFAGQEEILPVTLAPNDVRD